ncbi:MAG: ornithine cyclodeaminase family protein [Acidobacteriota bacterium]
MDHRSLFLESADIRAIVGRVGIDALMDDLIARLTAAIRVFDPASSQVPPRSGVYYEKPEWGLLEWMPAHLGAQGTTVKLVGYHPANPARRGVPSVVSTICVFDSNSGHLQGLLDGTFITAVRTGAASAVASRVLALAESRTVGVIGCGAQAVTQLHALSRLFTIERIIVHDIDDEVAGTLPDRIRFLDVPVEIVAPESVPDLLRASDILCTCTSSAPGGGPIFADFDNKPHLHVNAVGSDFQGKFEVPLELLQRSLVCPDFHEQAIAEGDCQQLQGRGIGPDLRTLIQNEAAYAYAKAIPTVFDSTGWALEDHVAASMMLDYAREVGVGRLVEFECLSPDPKDPYSLVPPLARPSHAPVGAATPNRP